jgi:hypothetical protein
VGAAAANRVGYLCARIVLAVACIAAVTACGSGGSAGGVATGSGSTADVQFAECMRTHGVPEFPDPLPGGGFPRVGRQSPASRTAHRACIHLLKAGSGARHGPTRAELAAALNYARCMRAHGVPDFSDPVTSLASRNTNVIVDGLILFPLSPSTDPSAPAFQRADGICGQPRTGHPQGG